MSSFELDENKVELIKKFCFSNDLSTSDPYDIWKTGFGLNVKHLFNKNKLAGFLPASLLTIFDQYFNNETRSFYKRQEFPVVRALAASSLLNIFSRCPEPVFLGWAVTHLDWLITHYSNGYSGFCWGANMPWASKNGTYAVDTPYITNTPYALEAMVAYTKATGDSKYDKVIESVYYFIDNDLHKVIDEGNLLCLSYSPVKEPRVVINANSYALYSLSLLLEYLPDRSFEIERNISRIYNFIKCQQNDDGSWWYYADRRKGNFIDCFHSCFILKNLLKASSYIDLGEDAKHVIEKGYKYLKSNFFERQSGLFKRFSKTDKVGLVKFDLYDNAEMMNLAYMCSDIDMFNSLDASIKSHFVEGETIYSIIDIFNNKKNKNMLRWAVMPYLYALSNSPGSFRSNCR